MIRFVPYKKFNGNPAALAKELLDAVPKQISKYFVIIVLFRNYQAKISKSMTQILLKKISRKALWSFMMIDTKLKFIININHLLM